MYLDRLREEIEKYYDERNYDLVKAKKIILRNQKSIDGWIENTKIVEDAGRLDEDYFRRTVVGVLEDNNTNYHLEMQNNIKDIQNE